MVVHRLRRRVVTLIEIDSIFLMTSVIIVIIISKPFNFSYVYLSLAEWHEHVKSTNFWVTFPKTTLHIIDVSLITTRLHLDISTSSLSVFLQDCFHDFISTIYKIPLLDFNILPDHVCICAGVQHFIVVVWWCMYFFPWLIRSLLIWGGFDISIH